MLGELVVKLNAETTGFTRPVVQAKTGLENVSSAAINTGFHINTIGSAFTALGVASQALTPVNQRLGVLGNLSSLVAQGFGHIATGVSLVSTTAFTMTSAMMLLAKPLYGLVIVGKAVIATFALMFGSIIAPFRVALSVLTAFKNGVIAVLKPVLSLAKMVFNLKIAFGSFKSQIKLLIGFMVMLPPPMRLVVAGLAAIGVAGRAGAIAVNLSIKAFKLLGFAVLATTQPLKALGVAILFAGKSLVGLSLKAILAAKSLAKLALTSTVSGIKAIGSAAVKTGLAITSKLVSSAKAALKALLLIGVAATGWGIKLAADAEQAEIAFTTMLKSGTAARRVLGELEQFAASTPFQLKSLQDGAKQLLNAQVPTQQLTNKLRMLGDIAAGTGKPINDFVRIYAKVKSTGKVSLETLNQLAERGVPIYSALSQALGVNREEMLKMISSGKVGFEDLNKALESTATGTGVFAGGMAAQSTTIAGLWSTLKDNVSFAMRELGMNISSAFDFKGIMNSGITFFQGLRTGISSAAPVFVALATTVRAAFGAIWEIVSVVSTSIADAMGLSGGNIMQSLMETLAVATWVFKSWPDIAELAFTKMGLFAVQGFGILIHFFTGVIPALLTWFGGNWKDIFFTAFDVVMTVFENIGKNVRNIMSSIWDFIKSGGTKSLSLAWTPLLDGFKNTIKEIPDIPKRAIGDLEKSLAADAARIGNKVAGDLQTEIEANLMVLDDSRRKKPIETDEDPGTLPDKIDNRGEQSREKAAGNNAVNNALNVRSSEGISAVLKATQGGAQSIQKKQTKHLARMEKLAVQREQREQKRENRELSNQRKQRPKVIKF